MNKNLILNATIILIIILVASLLTQISYQKSEYTITPEENIEKAILSTQLSSYGWRNQQDYEAAMFHLKAYINSELKRNE